MAPELRYDVMAHGIIVPRDATASVASRPQRHRQQYTRNPRPRPILNVRVGYGKS